MDTNTSIKLVYHILNLAGLIIIILAIAKDKNLHPTRENNNPKMVVRIVTICTYSLITFLLVII